MTEPTTLVPAKAFSPFRFHGAGLTHAGLVRKANEDSILTDPTGALWAVADGMGGHGHGDIASDIVIDHLSQMSDDGDPPSMFRDLLSAANQAILQRAQSFGADVMGATVVTLMLRDTVGYLAWVGDSRAYLCRNGDIRMLSHDHTVVQDLIDQGMIGTDDAKGHAGAHVITRAVGADIEIEVDQARVALQGRDRLVLCSDGLTGCVDDDGILSIVDRAEDPDDACRLLVTEALEAGAPDNVSAIVIFVEEH